MPGLCFPPHSTSSRQTYLAVLLPLTQSTALVTWQSLLISGYWPLHTCPPHTHTAPAPLPKQNPELPSAGWQQLCKEKQKGAVTVTYMVACKAHSQTCVDTKIGHSCLEALWGCTQAQGSASPGPRDPFPRGTGHQVFLMLTLGLASVI